MATTDVPTYYDRINPDLLNLIPPDARVVLEIGCGTGRLAEAFRRINPAVEWWGVEPNERAASEATDRTYFVYPMPIEDCSLWLDDRQADCIICGDVLEHMQDPWMQLRRLASVLKPGGQILASIPNVGHLSIIVSLLRGQWTYADEGLLDKTHLRWFTLATAKELFQQAGLEVFEVRSRTIDPTGKAEEWNLFLKGAPVHILGVNREALAKQSMAYQFLVRAIKPAVPILTVEKTFKVGGHDCEAGNVIYPADPIAKLHLHATLDPFGPACHRQRIHEPFRFLTTIPGVRTTTSSLADGIEAAIPYLPVGSPSVLILQRCQAPAAQYLAGLRAVRAQRPDTLIVAEWDDSPEDFPSLVDADFLTLKAIHAVQITTDVMAETVRKWNPHVKVMANHIAELPELKPLSVGPPTIFFGALNRKFEWLPIMPALNRVLADHPDVWVQVVHDSEFYGALETPNKRFEPFSKYEDYRKLIRGCDIALLPLEPCRFCERKSDLKFLECGAEMTAVLASETVYKSTILSCVNGLIFRHPEDFDSMLRDLIIYPNLRHGLAAEAYAYVRDYRMLKDHYRDQDRWYREMLARRSELDREMLDRVPKLDLVDD